jgi:hypothetical protein
MREFAPTFPNRRPTASMIGPRQSKGSSRSNEVPVGGSKFGRRYSGYHTEFVREVAVSLVSHFQGDIHDRKIRVAQKLLSLGDTHFSKVVPVAFFHDFAEQPAQVLRCDPEPLGQLRLGRKGAAT